MRILAFVLLVTVAFARCTIACGGPGAPAATLSPPEQTATFTIQVRNGPDLHAILVEPWPQDFIRLTNAKNERTFVPISKVLAIQDGDGADRTEEVLVQRRALGEVPVQPAAYAEPPRVITTPISSFVVGKDSILVASRVEGIGSEKVVVSRVDGVTQSLSSHQILWIRGLDGQDYTSAVTQKGKRLEESPILVGFPASEWNFRRLRGQPMPYRSVFPILQGGGLGFVGKDDGYDRRGLTAVGEIGAMRNLSEQVAVGFSGSLAIDGRYQRYGLKSRARYWLAKDAAFDFAPGIIGVDDSNPDWSTYPGFTAETALSIADLLIISASVESFREVMYVGTGARYEQTTTSWHLGLKLGGELALPGMIAAIALQPHEASVYDRGF